MTAADSPSISGPLRDLQTARLDLRRFQESDVDELAQVFSDPEVWRFPLDRGMTQDETAAFLERQIAHWTERGFGCWCAREIATGRVIGYLGLSVPTFAPEVLPAVEVGWRLASGSWGKGYATEGGAAALDEAFGSLGLERVCSIPQAGNAASARVAERLGMRFVRELILPATERRGEVPALFYEITRDEWMQART